MAPRKLYRELRCIDHPGRPSHQRRSDLNRRRDPGDREPGCLATDTDVGIGWSQGPLGLGVQYGSRDDSAGGFEVTAINAAYDLGPGVQINSQLAMGSAGDSDFSEFLLGTTISF